MLAIDLYASITSVLHLRHICFSAQGPLNGVAVLKNDDVILKAIGLCPIAMSSAALAAEP
jgi:hypothetical protein